MAATNVAREKKKPKRCPNPLFEQWLTEWRDEAARKGLKTQHTYAKALKSLQRFPLPLNSGKEAHVLEYFGDKICQMLDDKLAARRNQAGENSTANQATVSTSELDRLLDAEILPSKNKKQRYGILPGSKASGYVPAPNSGGYAILIALYKSMVEQGCNFMSKAELLDKAQPYCHASLTVPPPGSHYTAWSSMGVLVKKCLVLKEGNPARYHLTEEGEKLGERLLELHDTDERRHEFGAGGSTRTFVLESGPSGTMVSSTGHSNLHSATCHALEKDLGIARTTTTTRNVRCVQREPDDPEVLIEDRTSCSSGFSSQESTSSSTDFNYYTLEPGSFEILLCIDNCETSAGAFPNRKMTLLPELIKNGVAFNVRKLNVGDFVWIAKEKVLPHLGQLQLPTSRELVLDFIIERKRWDDLASSIKDGRFHEQKFRLRNCGLRRPIYLVESFGSGQNFGIPTSSLNQAVVNTQVINGFSVKRTKDQKETVAFLTIMTRYLQSLYSSRTLHACHKDDLEKDCTNTDRFMTFKEFNAFSIKKKNLTVTEMFIKQLLQLHGLSVDKATAIVNKYPTPARLIEALDACTSEKEKENLLASLRYGSGLRKLGPVLSKTICQLYTTEIPLT